MANSRTRKARAAVKKETFRQEMLLIEGYNARDNLIRTNLSKPKSRVEYVKIAGLPVTLMSGFGSSVTLVEQGAGRGRGVAQWGETPGERRRIARTDIEPNGVAITVDTSIPVKPAIPKDQPLYPRERKFNRETGKMAVTGKKRWSRD